MAPKRSKVPVKKGKPTKKQRCSNESEDDRLEDESTVPDDSSDDSDDSSEDSSDDSSDQESSESDSSEGDDSSEDQQSDEGQVDQVNVEQSAESDEASQTNVNESENEGEDVSVVVSNELPDLSGQNSSLESLSKVQEPKPSTSTRGLLTAQGKERQRRLRFSKEENYSLFSNLIENKEALTRTGPDPDKNKKSAWDDLEDSVNAIGNNDRNYDEIRKHINTFYKPTQVINEYYLERFDKGKVFRGCNRVQVFCLQWKEVHRIACREGKVIYGKGPKIGQRVKPLIPVTKYKKAHKSKHGKSKCVKVVSKKTSGKSSKSHPKKKKTKSSSETSTPVQKSTPAKNSPPATKVNKKSPSVKKSPAAPTQKGKKPIKTIRNRGPLPDMGDDSSPYVKGSLFERKRVEQKAKCSALDTSDDLRCTMYDPGRSQVYVDLTGGGPTDTSTPKETTEVERRSPRIMAKQSKTVKSTSLPSGKTHEKPASSGSAAKKQLSFEEAPNENIYSNDGSEDMAMRVARLESLLSSCEMNRREAENRHNANADRITGLVDRLEARTRESEVHNNEMHARIGTVLERVVSDREMIVRGFQNSTDNQRKLVAVCAVALDNIVASAEKYDTASQTDDLPHLNAMELVIEDQGGGIDGQPGSISVKAVDPADNRDPKVCVSTGAFIYTDVVQEIKVEEEQTLTDIPKDFGSDIVQTTHNTEGSFQQNISYSCGETSHVTTKAEVLSQVPGIPSRNRVIAISEVVSASNTVLESAAAATDEAVSTKETVSLGIGVQEGEEVLIEGSNLMVMIGSESLSVAQEPVTQQPVNYQSIDLEPEVLAEDVLNKYKSEAVQKEVTGSESDESTRSTRQERKRRKTVVYKDYDPYEDEPNREKVKGKGGRNPKTKAAPKKRTTKKR